jgi:site-specific DNA recombinase
MDGLFEVQMNPALLYARVSSKDQEQEGYSIPAQLKMLREYARSHDMQILQEFVDVETAKATGRKQFGEMVRFLQKHSTCKTLLVEKTDRLYRNFRDYVTLEELGIEIHLPKEGQVIGKNSKSQAKLVHGIQLVIAGNYIENLREEVKKGMREKAEQGIYPSRPPLGYRNNKAERTIETNLETAPYVKRIFELYATGQYSLSKLRKQIRIETGQTYQKGYLHKLLKNPFYAGLFLWEGKTYKGTHDLLIPPSWWQEVQLVLKGHNRPKYRKHDFPFSGLLTCAHDECRVTAERKKGKYTYYRCTGYRGKCALPYFREEELGMRLGQILKDIYIPDDVVACIQRSLQEDAQCSAVHRQTDRERLTQRLKAVRGRLDQIYVDKLDGKVPEDFWERKTAEWRTEEGNVLLALQGLEQSSPDRMLNATRILELANKSYFLYLTQNPAEQGKLLKMVLSNCAVDAVSLYPTYRKPFDVIFERAKTKEWCALRDSNSRPSGS